MQSLRFRILQICFLIINLKQNTLIRSELGAYKCSYEHVSNKTFAIASYKRINSRVNWQSADFHDEELAKPALDAHRSLFFEKSDYF